MRIVMLLLLFMLASCSTIPPYQGPESFSAKDLTEGGYITGSIAINLRGKYRSPFSRQQLYFNKVGSDEQGRLTYASDSLYNTPTEFKVAGGKGSTFSALLKPGNYELTGVSFYFNNGQYEKNFWNRKTFSIPFRVEQGKTIYLGSFTVHGVWRKNFLGIPVIAGGFFVNQQAAERDYPIINMNTGVPADSIAPYRLMINGTAKSFIRTSKPANNNEPQ